MLSGHGFCPQNYISRLMLYEIGIWWSVMKLMNWGEDALLSEFTISYVIRYLILHVCSMDFFSSLSSTVLKMIGGLFLSILTNVIVVSFLLVCCSFCKFSQICRLLQIDTLGAAIYWLSLNRWTAIITLYNLLFRYK